MTLLSRSLMTTPDASLSPMPPPAKRPRGRPRIFNETRRQTLCTLISIGLSRAEACRKVDVPPSSVVHAARTDAVFAQQLQQALVQCANRPPELADIGSRKWRAAARRLEAIHPDEFVPGYARRTFAEARLRRQIDRIVLKLLRKRFRATAASRSPRSAADYCCDPRTFRNVE